MKRNMKVSVWSLPFFLLLSATLLTPVGAWAANPPKLGYFEMATVLQQSKWGKQSNDEFKAQGERVKGEVDQKAKAFKAAKEEFDKKKDVMDEKTKAKKVKELQEMQQEGEKLLMESNAKLNKLSNELTSPIIDKILEIVRRIGRDDKYDYIMEREKSGLVFVNEKEDLTKKIIEELDKTPRK